MKEKTAREERILAKEDGEKFAEHIISLGGLDWPLYERIARNYSTMEKGVFVEWFEHLYKTPLPSLEKHPIFFMFGFTLYAVQHLREKE